MKRLTLIITMLFTGFVLINGQTKPDDIDIVDAIENEFIFDHAVNNNKVDVTVTNGIVELTGTVTNLKAKKAAEMLAENTYGVSGVTNRIKVKTEDIEDSEIQADINEALSDNAITEAWDIGVFVQNGVATLAGRVDSYLEKT
ncbi:MAG: BON domain-containing protein [Bacteroidales bacterium]|nr:BON domain-containing protein [Bacteroidales bacterium]MDT8430435.1 BON domain-containing protein [Bacteroidales bacterium]